MEPPSVEMQPGFNFSAMVNLRLAVPGHAQAFKQFQKLGWIYEVTKDYKILDG
jgi:hypothetical protein